MVTPEIQHELIADAPEIFSQLPNKWGFGGATRALLDKISRDEMLSVLKLAWELAQPKEASTKVR